SSGELDKNETQELTAKVEEEEKNFNPENGDIGLDPNLPTNYDIPRIEDVSVPGPLKPDEAVGNDQGNGPVQTVPPPPGVGEKGQAGAFDAATPGLGNLGAPGGLDGPP